MYNAENVRYIGFNGKMLSNGQNKSKCIKVHKQITFKNSKRNMEDENVMEISNTRIFLLPIIAILTITVVISGCTRSSDKDDFSNKQQILFIGNDEIADEMRNLKANFIQKKDFENCDQYKIILIEKDFLNQNSYSVIKEVALKNINIFFIGITDTKEIMLNILEKTSYENIKAIDRNNYTVIQLYKDNKNELQLNHITYEFNNNKIKIQKLLNSIYSFYR